MHSAHNHSTLIAWKRGEIRRVASVSSTRLLFMEGIKMFMNRLKRYMEPVLNLKALAKFDPYTDLAVKKCVRLTFEGTTRSIRPPTAWLVLPYHWIWKGCHFNSILETMMDEWMPHINGAFASKAPFKAVRESWKLTGLRFVDAVKSWASEDPTTVKIRVT